MFGLVGLGYMLYTDKVNPWLAIIFASMAQVPGLVGLITLLRGVPTSGSELQSQLASESSSSSSSSSTS